MNTGFKGWHFYRPRVGGRIGATRKVKRVVIYFFKELPEEMKMWERFKFWMSGQKDCAGCCLGCSYYEECKADVMEEATEIEMQEAYERDLVIDAIIRERMKGHSRKTSYRKSA